MFEILFSYDYAALLMMNSPITRLQREKGFKTPLRLLLCSKSLMELIVILKFRGWVLFVHLRLLKMLENIFPRVISAMQNSCLMVLQIFRKEGWATLLWEVLGYLQECSRKQGAVKEFVEFSLEMTALPVSTVGSIQSSKCGPGGPASLEQRDMIHREIFALVSGEARPLSLEGTDDLKVTGDSTLHIEIDLVSPLRSVLLASVAFHEQIIKSGVPSLITLSLLSQLPLSIEINQLDVQFNQSECNFIIMNAQKGSLQAVSGDRHDHLMESAPSLVLITNKWLRLTYDIKSGKSAFIFVHFLFSPSIRSI